MKTLLNLISLVAQVVFQCLQMLLQKFALIFHSLCNSKKYDEAKGIFDKLLPLHDVMFVESNPVPAKYSLNLMGMMSEEVRLPLVNC